MPISFVEIWLARTNYAKHTHTFWPEDNPRTSVKHKTEKGTFGVAMLLSAVVLLLPLLIIQSLVSLQYSCEYCRLQELYNVPGFMNSPPRLKLQAEEHTRIYETCQQLLIIWECGKTTWRTQEINI
jgi:hypothetical protein